MANSIFKLKVETSEYDQKLANAAKGIRHLADVAHKSEGDLTGLEKAELDYIKALGDMETKSRTASGQLRELSSSYKELKVVYDQLNEVEKADEGGKALAASLETLKQRAQEAKAQLDTATQSLNDNGEAGKGTSSVMEMLKDKFTVNIDAIKLFNIGLQAAEGALSVAKDAFFNNEEQLDEWGRVVESSHSLYTGFLNALNTGDISGYLSNINQIVQAARDAYDALDALGTYNAFNQINVERTRTNMTESIADYRGGKGSKDTVKAAGEAYKKELQDRKRLENEAYLAAVKRVAAERGVSAKDLTDALSGTYGHYQDLKNVQPTGVRQTVVGAGMFARTGTETFAQTRQEKLGEALRHLNDTELQSLQALGAQAQRTGNEIAQVDKQLTRVLNGRQPGGSGSGGGGKGGKTEVEAAIGSIDYQTKKVQELQKAWQAAADDDSRRKIKEEIESAQAVLDNMTGKVFDPSKMKQIAPTAIAAPKMELTDPMGTVNTMKQSIKLELKTEAVKVDETTLQTMLKDAVQNGINGMDFQFNAIGKKIGAGLDVPDSAWEGILEQYNALREQIGLDPITIEFKTGGLKEAGKDAKSATKDFQQAASAIGSVGSALSSIEDPGAKVAGIVAQAIATVASAFASALGTDTTTKSNIWAFIAAAAASTATMISTIASIHSATGYANGGQIKGNSYSGDNILGMVDGGGIVGLNAGEIVLNQAQTANVANALEGGGMRGIDLSAVVTGEQIFLVINRYTKRTGQGEIVTWK